MELRYYFSILWRRKWVITVTALIVLIITAIGQSIITPTYTATTTLRVAASMGLSQGLQFYTYNTQLMNTYVELASSRPVMEELAKRLQTDQLLKIEAEVVPDTELFRITASSPDPKLAASASSTLAQILVEQSDQLYAGGEKTNSELLASQVEQAQVDLNETLKEYERLIIQTPPAPARITLANQTVEEKQQTYVTLLRQYEQAQYREAMQASMITIVDDAVIPTVPSEPRTTLNLALAVILGLFAGVMLAFVFENMDEQLHTTRDIENIIQTPALAKLPRTSENHLNISKNGSSPLAESVRYLAARIQLADQSPHHKVFVFTGTELGQGATTATANLGCALAEQGRNVVMVDCNIRTPKLHELFDLPNKQGVTDILSGKLDPTKTTQKTGIEHLSLLPTGPVADTPLHAFESARIETLIKTLRQQFEYVLIDAPPLNVADIVTIAPHADELVLVAKRSHIRREAIQSAWGYLSKFNGKSVELIVNEAEELGALSFT